jgi:hypothetical protein
MPRQRISLRSPGAPCSEQPVDEELVGVCVVGGGDIEAVEQFGSRCPSRLKDVPSWCASGNLNCGLMNVSSHEKDTNPAGEGDRHLAQGMVGQIVARGG